MSKGPVINDNYLYLPVILIVVHQPSCVAGKDQPPVAPAGGGILDDTGMNVASGFDSKGGFTIDDRPFDIRYPGGRKPWTKKDRQAFRELQVVGNPENKNKN